MWPVAVPTPCGRGRDEEVLALAQGRGAGQGGVGGQAGAAEDGEVRLQRDALVAAQLAGAAGAQGDEGVGAPALAVEDQVALGESGVAGGQDPAHRAALQRGAELEAALAAVHQPAVVRVHGEQQVLHQGGTGPRLGDGVRT